MNAFGIIQTTISHNVKDPHSKALEPDCLSLPSLCDYDTVSKGGEVSAGEGGMREKLPICKRVHPLPGIPGIISL
jgi:hypothetical protein